MLEFKKKKLKFKYDDEEHCIRFPSVKDLGEYQKKYKEAEDSDAPEIVIDFLVRLGLDQGVAEVLESDHVAVIMKELTDAKKN